MKNSRCDICGRFRKAKDLVEMSSDDEYLQHLWLECVYCMSDVDFGRYFYGQKRPVPANSDQEQKK